MKLITIILLALSVGCAGILNKLNMKEKLEIGFACAVVTLGGAWFGSYLTEKEAKKKFTKQLEGMKR